MMRYKIILLLVFAFAKADNIIAQHDNNTKVEQEERIDIAYFPIQARDMVFTLSKARKKIKYYKETDGSLITYEAKFKLNGYKYSIECDQKGILIDIEVLIKKKEIASSVLNIITNNLKEISNRFKVEKIQKQFVINHQDSLSISNRLESNDFDNYEMIVAFKKDNKIYRKEMLFSKEGELLKQRSVKKLKYDFILF